MKCDPKKLPKLCKRRSHHKSIVVRNHLIVMFGKQDDLVATTFEYLDLISPAAKFHQVKINFNIAAFEHSVILHKPESKSSFYLLSPTVSRNLDSMVLYEAWIIFTNEHPSGISLKAPIYLFASSVPHTLPPRWAHARFNGNLDTNKRYNSQEGKWMILDERGYEYVVEVQQEKRALVKVRDVKAS